jgi:hypothetical protein
MIRDNVEYPTQYIGPRSYRNKFRFYDVADIERLKESLEENDLTFELSDKKSIRLATSLKMDPIELYDIVLTFNDDADEAFYIMLISDLP